MITNILDQLAAQDIILIGIWRYSSSDNAQDVYTINDRWCSTALLPGRRIPYDSPVCNSPEEALQHLLDVARYYKHS